MAPLKQLVAYCNDLLLINDFDDYCPNGLQVEGKANINCLVTGVTASRDLIDRAIAQGADALLVHHGYFWKGEDASIVGLKKQRIARLLQNDISLLAYHLPLDAHTEYGNNIELARRLGIRVTGVMDQGRARGLLWYGELEQVLTANELSERIATALNRQPLHLSSSSQQPIHRLAWCTGGAQGYIEAAAQLGVDAYISGEVSEQTFHLARELDIHYFAAGHHATESYGVQALGLHLAEQFELESKFIDVFNPV
ncbi:MAG: Nif3-like dinuclear metal center hexameric protein [Gammaproteobacteria bacterium]|nr:Nif3-like dinuclear metal center hexameric protein [Gammaproteobacteria bacterium]